MDYTTQGLGFRMKKALRYVRLYGVRRTLMKVKAQYHMKKKYAFLPEQSPVHDEGQGGHVGLIGCGNFAFSTIAYYIAKKYGRVIRGVMDVDIHKAASLWENYGALYYTDNADRIIADPDIDLVYIASNHASHAEYAIQALEAGKCVHIEKPHVVREEQLRRLCEAMSRSKGQVSLGFNRPYSPVGMRIKHYLDMEAGPAMFNWFVAGHELPADHWYFAEEEGGRILGNLCHWTDFVLQLVAPEDRYPLTITPTRGEKSDCDIAVTYTFGNESIAVITFSAKGHTFEGVRETFSAHRGNVLISMTDFKVLVVEIVDKKRKIGSLFRNHGHDASVMSSYEMVRPKPGKPTGACSLDYVWETGELFLQTRAALEANKKLVLRSYRSGREQDCR